MSNPKKPHGNVGSEVLTDEEHQARAMLMGLSYHHGNGDPFYYTPDEFGVPIASTIRDANTLELILKPDDRSRNLQNFVTDDIVNATLRQKQKVLRHADMYGRVWRKKGKRI